MTRLDDDVRERLRAAAREYLATELAKLEAAGVMPEPRRDSPWIDRQRLWRTRGPGSESELAKALVAAAPDRWPGPSGLAYVRAAEYVDALLRAAVAAATVEAFDPGWMPTPEGLIDELIDHVENHERPVRLLRLLTDVDVGQVEGETIHEARMRSVRGLPDTLGREMFEAASEADRLHVPGGSREPRAFLVAERPGPDAWMVAFDLRPHLIHAATALRLVTAATIVERLEVYGQPQMVHVGGPSASEVDQDPGAHWRRVGVVHQEQLAGVEAIAGQICSLDPRPPVGTSPSIAIAIGRFNRSFRAAAWPDVVIDIAIGLEAALSTGDEQEITLRIKSRAAHLLARPGDPPTAIFTDIGKLLDIRGKVAHGAIVPERVWTGLFETHGLDQVLVEDRLSVLFDRWRDVLRRAILARLLLDSGGGPWTLRRVPDGGVDAALVGPVGRHACRGAICRRAAELGIASAIDRPPPLRDFLHEPYSDRLDN